MSVEDGGSTDHAYDALGRLDALSSPAGTWDYSYVGNSGLLNQITNPNGTKSVYSYDALERLTQVSNQKSTSANLSTFAYGFDDTLDPQRDVRTSLEKTIGANPMQRVDYGYDGVDQLTSEVLSQGGSNLQSKSFAYDAMGNRTAAGSVTPSDTVSGTYTNNRLNQIVGYNSSWGGGANTLTSTLQYDQGGNLTRNRAIGTGSATSTHTEYIYDDIDRLTAVITKHPSTLANQNKTEFQYDGLSRLRISKEFTWSGSAWTLISNSEIRRVYDGMDVVQERDDDNDVTVTYTRDGNIGGILSRRSGSTSYYYHYNGSGNVVGMTDNSQNSVAEYAYDAYGNLLSSSGSQASNNNYRYSTKEHFGSIGLYNYGYRFYSPGFGRWINRDPIEEEGGINLYAAVVNDPVNDWDEYGEMPGADRLRVIGVAVVVACKWVAGKAGSLFKKTSKQQNTRVVVSNAANKLPNLKGKTRSQAETILRKEGYDYKGKTAGGYDKWYHPDGSRVQIRPNGEVVRTGPKQKTADGTGTYRPRIGANGKPTNSHNTGEILKK